MNFHDINKHISEGAIKLDILLLSTKGCAAMLVWVGIMGFPPMSAVAGACWVVWVVCPLLTARFFPLLLVEVTAADTWACNGVKVIPEFYKF